jgi:hypothetical protein
MIDRNIFHTSEEEILLQTHDRQYKIPLNSTPITSETTSDTARKPLMILLPNIEPNPRIPLIPLQRNVHKPHARAACNYIMVDELVQSPAIMFVLEVLQTYPS